MTPGKMIEKYLELRQKLREVEARHKAELAPYLKLREQLDIAMLDYLNTNGLDSTKCDAGTAFRSTVTSVTVRDWTATLDHIRKHDLWDLLEARVAKGAAVDIINESQEPIPGVEISQATVLRVRSG